MNKYHLIVCGGTFDLLHTGHRKFLSQIFEKGEKVIIGLTSDKYISENKSDKNVSSYDSRKKELENFIKENGVENRVQIVSIDDMYGPLLDSTFQADAVAVTSDSRKNAEKINDERKTRGLEPVEILEINLVKDEEGEVISSTKIRENLLLPSTLRPLLQHAWGEIVSEIPSDIDSSSIVTVGDITTGKFIEKGIFPKLMIIDNKVERKEKKFSHEIPLSTQKIVVENPPGSITKELFGAVEDALEKDTPVLIEVIGEEDLAVLPVLLTVPVGYKIYYGQPHAGMVELEVTQEIRGKARSLIDRFEIV